MHEAFTVIAWEKETSKGRDGFVATLELVGLGDELVQFDVFVRRTPNMDMPAASRKAE